MIDQVAHASGQGQRSLVTDGEDFVCASVSLNHSLDLSDDTGVDTTAETLVGSDGDEEPFFGGEGLSFLLEEGLAVDDFLDGSNAEVFGFFESGDVCSHFGGSDHLHGLE